MVREQSHDDEGYELNTAYPDRDDISRFSFEDDNGLEHLLGQSQEAYPQQRSLTRRLIELISCSRSSHWTRSRRRTRLPTILGHLSIRNIALLIGTTVTAILFVTSVFFPSYTNPPPRYAELKRQAQSSSEPGAGNSENQKIFIAASIFDKSGKLSRGHWGDCVLNLVQLLGPKNVYLSIYENDAGEVAKEALNELKARVPCDHTIRFEDHLDLNEVNHVTLPDGSTRIKRLDYLAEARNRALEPIDNAYMHFDKLLYLNDVVFDPIDALHLLFSTNAIEPGRAGHYRAACAVDFINPIKYYDTFASRDFEGYGIGLPIFPWFTTAGQGLSRRQVLAGSDAVQVKSCWGGMVAFDARYFQPPQNPADVPVTAGVESPSNISAPYKFRAEADLYWDASECCLIHADIQDPTPGYSGIFVNPYVRTAYDWNTLQWLGTTRRFERLLTPIHWFLSKLIGMPWSNPRQFEQPFQKVEEQVWVTDPDLPSGGSFQMVERSGTHSGFCGRRALQVLKQDITEGEKNWEFLPIPT